MIRVYDGSERAASSSVNATRSDSSRLSTQATDRHPSTIDTLWAPSAGRVSSARVRIYKLSPSSDNGVKLRVPAHTQRTLPREPSPIVPSPGRPFPTRRPGRVVGAHHEIPHADDVPLGLVGRGSDSVSGGIERRIRYGDRSHLGRTRNEIRRGHKEEGKGSQTCRARQRTRSWPRCLDRCTQRQVGHQRTWSWQGSLDQCRTVDPECRSGDDTFLGRECEYSPDGACARMGGRRCDCRPDGDHQYDSRKGYG